MARRKVKTVKKALATIMTVSMIMSSTSIGALANVDVATSSNAEVKVTVNGPTTTVDSNGVTITVTETVTESKDTTNEDVVIESEKTEIETIKTDSENRVLEESGSESGSETTTETETNTDTYTEDRDNLENDDYIDGTPDVIVDDKGEWSNPVETEKESIESTEIDPGYAGDITTSDRPWALT